MRRADAIRKNFGDSLAQSVKARETAKAALFKARRDYVETFKPCSFQTEVMDNEEFEAEQKVLEESELPKYRKKIEAARESALEQFQNDFLAKLKSSIDQGTWDRQAVRFCHLKVNLSLPRLNRAGAGQFVEFRSGIDA